jgi:hypothetical protein
MASTKKWEPETDRHTGFTTWSPAAPSLQVEEQIVIQITENRLHQELGAGNGPTGIGPTNSTRIHHMVASAIFWYRFTVGMSSTWRPAHLIGCTRGSSINMASAAIETTSGDHVLRSFTSSANDMIGGSLVVLKNRGFYFLNLCTGTVKGSVADPDDFWLDPDLKTSGSGPA